MNRHSLIIHVHIPKTAGTTLSRVIRLLRTMWPLPHWFAHAAVTGYYPLRYSRITDIERRSELVRR